MEKQHIRKYEAAFLLRCWEVGADARSNWRLRDIMNSSLRAALPWNLRDQCVQILETMSIPSAPSMHRFRFRLDNAFMRWRKSRTASTLASHLFLPAAVLELFESLQIVYTWWLDSSPQGNIDYMVISSVAVHVDMLVQLQKTINQLAELNLRIFYLEPQEVPSHFERERVELEAIIDRACDLHRWPLTALGGGPGVATMIHKAGCWLHAAHLESAGPLSLKALFAGTVGICTDLGTESSFGQALDLDMGSVFECRCGPAWRVPSQIFLEEDLEPCGGAESLPVGATFSHLLPFGLVCPGNLHMLDGVEAKMTQHLPCWEWLCPRLKAMARFLHLPHPRRRLQAQAQESPTATPMNPQPTPNRGAFLCKVCSATTPNQKYLLSCSCVTIVED